VQYRMAEFRASDDGAGLSGYASHFWSVDSYLTAMQPGAFKRTIKRRGDRVPILWQHNPDYPIGRPTSLAEDGTGLKFDAAISERTSKGADAMALLRDGVPLGMSFGFQTTKSRPGTKDDPLDFSKYKAKPADVEVIEEVKLWEISVVTFPANELATINDVRAQAEADALTSLLEALRAGDLDEEDARWSQLQHLVAAFQERSEPEPEPIEATTPLPETIARRRNVDAMLALARYEGLIGAHA
jgi:HK97 family phage prohead protease